MGGGEGSSGAGGGGGVLFRAKPLICKKRCSNYLY